MNMKQILILFFLIAVNIQLTKGQNQSKVFDFPIKPGTKEWAKLKNNKEKVTACQIPNSQIKQLSTIDLLETCFNYPLLPDIFAFNNMQEGFDKFKDDFNGINELLLRKNISKILIEKYKNLDPNDDKKNQTLIEKGEFSIKFSLFEIFISQKEVLEQLDLKEKKDLVKELLSKYYNKSNNDIFGSLSFKTNAFCLVKILENEKLLNDFSNEKVRTDMLKFATMGNNITNKTFTNIILLSEQFINK